MNTSYATSIIGIFLIIVFVIAFILSYRDENGKMDKFGVIFTCVFGVIGILLVLVPYIILSR